MAVNFPSNPTNGDTVTVSGINYVYDSTQGVWSDSPQGLTQSIDNLTDVDTSTTAPTNRQVLQWNSTNEEWGPADSGVQVYATIDDLPLSGVTEGSMALVDSTDKLYIFSDSGWYSIAIVNQTPSISGVSATYTLATDGTATTVTVTATDPEGVPLTYSIVSDTSGNIATVAQGTGANTNQWTITPSTNTANAGSFTLVFRASDGVNIASASSTFTLQFSIENSNYTAALITSVGANNAVNNSFTDSSTNNHTITASGNVTQGTFSPYRHGGNSVLFPGGDQGDGYLDMGAAIVPATGSWTFQSWIRVTQHSDATDRHTLLSWYQNSQSGRGDIQVRGRTETDPGTVFVYADGMSAYLYSTTRVDDGAWHHVAVERNGNVWSVWVDGTREDQVTQSVTLYTGSNTRIGQGINTTGSNFRNMNGEMRDVRFSESARYSGAATIDVPTEDETDTTGYSLLCCQSVNPFIDKTGTYTISVVAVNVPVKQVGAGPYDHRAYSTADNGGSMYFDGTGDYLDVPDNSSFDFDGDFCVELWLYRAGDTATSYQGIIGGNGNSQNGWHIYVTNSTNALAFYFSSFLLSGGTVIDNQWNHVAVTRSGTSLQMFLNGSVVDSATNSTTFTDSSVGNGIRIGYDFNGNGYYAGNIADVRIVKGTAVYTSAFTPPTAPLTAITNTSLLLNGTDAGIIDKSQSVETITLNGDVKSSTTQSKYLTSSMYFDGTDDYLELPASSLYDFGSGDFTIEMWAYPQADADDRGAFFELYVDDNNLLRIFRNANDVIEALVRSGGTDQAKITSSITDDQWVHYALVNNNGTITFYKDGTSVGSDSSFTMPALSSARALIGLDLQNTDRWYTGYMSDVRITKGLARYTSNFTPPTAALQG